MSFDFKIWLWYLHFVFLFGVFKKYLVIYFKNIINNDI